MCEISSSELSEERPWGQVERNGSLPLQGQGVVGHPARPCSARGRQIEVVPREIFPVLWQSLDARGFFVPFLSPARELQGFLFTFALLCATL